MKSYVIITNIQNTAENRRKKDDKRFLFLPLFPLQAPAHGKKSLLRDRHLQKGVAQAAVGEGNPNQKSGIIGEFCWIHGRCFHLILAILLFPTPSLPLLEDPTSQEMLFLGAKDCFEEGMEIQYLFARASDFLFRLVRAQAT